MSNFSFRKKGTVSLVADTASDPIAEDVTRYAAVSRIG